MQRRGFLYRGLVSGAVAAGGFWLAGKPQSARAQVVNVRNPPYNAAGNGVTDDSYPIYRALQDADSVYVPTGIYFVSANCQLTRPGQHLYGDGMNATFFKRWDGLAGSMFVTTPTAQYSRLSHFSIECGRNNRDGASQELVIHAPDCVVTGVRVRNHRYMSYALNAPRIVMDSCHSIGIGDSGLSPWGMYFAFINGGRCYAPNLRITKCSFVNHHLNAIFGDSYGAQIDGCYLENDHIQGCDVTGGGQIGIGSHTDELTTTANGTRGLCPLVPFSMSCDRLITIDYERLREA